MKHPVALREFFDPVDHTLLVTVLIDGTAYGSFSYVFRAGGQELTVNTIERPTWTSTDAIRAIVRGHAAFRRLTLDDYEFFGLLG